MTHAPLSFSSIKMPALLLLASEEHTFRPTSHSPFRIAALFVIITTIMPISNDSRYSGKAMHKARRAYATAKQLSPSPPKRRSPRNHPSSADGNGAHASLHGPSHLSPRVRQSLNIADPNPLRVSRQNDIIMLYV